MPFSREADRAALSHSLSFDHRLHWVRYAQNTRRACQRHDAAGISLRPHRTVGRNFDSEFRPELTPKQMLALGIFCGKYMTDCRKEFPASWFANARLSSCRDCSLNYFGVDASQPLSVWRKNGWIHPDDPRGGFQWYCRYYMGRRVPSEDARQIKRWKAIRRHVAQIRRHCEPGDPTVGHGSARLCSTGLTTAAEFDPTDQHEYTLVGENHG